MRDSDLISLSLLIAARKQRYGQLLLELHVEEDQHPYRKHTRELAGRAAEVRGRTRIPPCAAKEHAERRGR